MDQKGLQPRDLIRLKTVLCVGLFFKKFELPLPPPGRDRKGHRASTRTLEARGCGYESDTRRNDSICIAYSQDLMELNAVRRSNEVNLRRMIFCISGST
jgi:hypothetical protein